MDTRWCLLLPVLLMLLSVVDGSAKKPNVIFILADDLGFNDVSWNNPDVVTPNLQRMADNGLILNQSYSQPVCTPSRASYLTGLYPFRTGTQVPSVVKMATEDYLPLDLTLLPEKLKEAGYSTHLVGKWHLGHCRRDATPIERGYDSHLGLYHGFNGYYSKLVKPNIFAPVSDSNKPQYDFFLNNEVFQSPETDYTTDVFTNRTIELIQDHKHAPFFISLHYTAPHWFLSSPPNFDYDIYKDVTDPDRKIYLAMVTAMDEGIGHVLQTLEDEGVMDNTVVIFQSDNGGALSYGASNFPLRGEKGQLYEGGTRAPTLVYGPGLIKNTPRVSDDLFHLVDWYSTVLGAAGVGAGRVDGVNQWPMLQDGVKGQRDVLVYNIWGDDAAIRAGNFKLIEGNPVLLRMGAMVVPELKRRKRSVREQRQNHGSSMSGPEQDDDYMIKKIFGEMSGVGNLKQFEWTMDRILQYLKGYEPEDVNTDSLPADVQLYDLTADPSEEQDLTQKYPAVAVYLHKMLEAYRTREAAPSITLGYKPDPRFSFNVTIVSNTWCES